MTKTKLFTSAMVFSLAIASARHSSAQDITLTKTPEQLTNPLQQLDAPQNAEPEAAAAQVFTPQGRIITPASSVSRPGKAVHTNYKIFVPKGQQISSAVPTYTFAETPASMYCVYNLTAYYTGCSPTGGSRAQTTGGWGAIALVDAYDNPNAAADLTVFNTRWKLPAANFTVVYANSNYGTVNGLSASCSGTPPPANQYGWDLEESLDVQWAHAMAPSAKIILVEACTQNLPDLLFAEEVAGIEVTNAGGGDISNSWGYPESEVGVSNDGGGTLTEEQDDNYFYRYFWSNITYFASAGDSASEVLYPSASPWVVSAGGTTINRDKNANFVSESCWADSGGGPSTVETWLSPPSITSGMGPWTNYQYALFGSGPRVTPDMSFNADPNSGVYVYDSNSGGGGWYIVGGTSVSSPALAGIINSANNRLSMATSAAGGYYTASELNYVYSELSTYTAYGAYFYDVHTGSNGYAAGKGYDQCTGIGSPRGKGGK